MHTKQTSLNKFLSDEQNYLLSGHQYQIRQ
jgi:hypothetical protein